MVRTTVNRSPTRSNKAAIQQRQQEEAANLPPKAAIWTHQVVELPPITAKKPVQQIVFEDEEDNNEMV